MSMLASGCTFTLMTFIANEYETFQPISEVHEVNTRHRHDLHRQTANLKVYTKFPVRIRNLSTERRQVQFALRESHVSQTFYSVNEFVNFTQVTLAC